MKQIFILVLLTLAFAQAHAQDRKDLRSGESLLRAMHDRYASSWYHTLTFTQKSTTYKPDGTSSSETWYEAGSFPGKLRIDVGAPSEGNGFILADGNVAVVKNNQVTGSRPLVNMLLVLGFDVYCQAPETTIQVVKAEGYDLAKIHEDTWEGHAAYVVGADQGDLKSRQFWIAKDTLLFLRVIEPAQANATKLNDIRFVHYQPLAGAWIAAGVEVFSEGRKVFSEDYTDIKANLTLAPAVFDPKQFASTHWEAEMK